MKPNTCLTVRFEIDQIFANFFRFFCNEKDWSIILDETKKDSYIYPAIMHRIVSPEINRLCQVLISVFLIRFQIIFVLMIATGVFLGRYKNPDNMTFWCF